MTTYNKFFIRTYASLEQIREILAEHDQEIKAHAFIEHNRDNCEWHRHIVLWLERSKAQKTIQNWFRTCFDAKGLPCQTRVEVTKICKKSDGSTETQTVYLKGATFYLVHEDTNGNPLPKKYHYSWEEVESKNLDLLKNYEFGKTKDQKKDCTFEILEAVISGESAYSLAKKYGRDFILNYRKYADLAYSIVCADEAERARKEEAENIARAELLSDLCDVAEPTSSAVISAQENEIERLKAILRSNKLEF